MQLGLKIIPRAAATAADSISIKQPMANSYSSSSRELLMKWHGGAVTRELWLEDSLGLGCGPGLAPLGLRAPPSGASAKRVQGCSAREVLPDSQGLLALLRPAKLGKSFSKGGCSSIRRHLQFVGKGNRAGRSTCDCGDQCC